MKTSLHHQLCSRNAAPSGRPLVGGRSNITRHFSLFTHHASRSGIALVITLILLAIITFMTITLLVITRGEKGSVTVTYDQTQATLAAEAAQERVKTALIAPMLAFTNPYNFDLLVSTNYINPLGFITTTPTRSNPTNVSYTYANGQPLNANDSLQNLQNLLYLPPAPVFMTNRLASPLGSNEFRSYIDLNRNGKFDPSGLLPVVGLNGNYFDTNGNSSPTPFLVGGVSNHFMGDPQWIGVLEKPDFPHSSTNRFISRYAYMAIPLSKTLDLNYMYDYTKFRAVNMAPGSDSFFRNMGVGTWEINLAAFLVDLNTNYWQFLDHTTATYPYQYYAFNNVQPNSGIAFEDALSLLRYRYNSNSKFSLLPVNTLFGLNGTLAFQRDGIDGYSHGPVMTGTTWQSAPDGDQGFANNFGWPGSDNPNHFETTQDLFDTSKTAMNVTGRNFTDRLASTAKNVSSYDRYTLYRLLAQLGTDSAPESGKIHLNYQNVDNGGNVVPNMATNFIPWTNAVQFFTNVAIRLMTNAGFSVGANFSPTNLVGGNAQSLSLNIQIWPTNFYTPSVHRLLQLAANIYDASTNRGLTPYPHLPSVFKPDIQRDPSGTHYYIKGYVEVTDLSVLTLATRDLDIPSERQTFRRGEMAYGVPLIIGAKKGFPNFNELGMETSVSVTRKLEFRRPLSTGSTVAPVNETNVMYIVGISNVFGVEAWNSYRTSFSRDLQLLAWTDMFAVMTNNFGTFLLNSQHSTNATQSIPENTWGGFGDPTHPGTSLRVPMSPATNHFEFMVRQTYNEAQRKFVPLTGQFESHPGSSTFPLPHWWLNLKTRLRFVIVDAKANRIVDYVNISPAQDPIDLTYELMRDGDCSEPYNPPHIVSPGAFWCTNRAPGTTDSIPTYGIRTQIKVGMGDLTATDWNANVGETPPGIDKAVAKDFFKYNLLGQQHSGIYLTNRFYSPYNPSRTLFIITSWQANDPLVHYTADDLLDSKYINPTNRVQRDTYTPPVMANMGMVNGRYHPWSLQTVSGSSTSSKPGLLDLSVKDPLVTRSDDWDFPTNKFPNIGWLGRVHRGTPWQTVYLKSPISDLNTKLPENTPPPTNVTWVEMSRFISLEGWTNWTGNGKVQVNWGQFNTNIFSLPVSSNLANANWTYDALLTHPTNDWGILDLFTTAFNDNAARGRLGINQENLAAWSAIFSGVIALQSDTNANRSETRLATNFAPVVIEPVVANNNSPLLRLVTAINDVRRTNFAGAFRKLGDILAVPEYSDKSPFINQTNRTLWNVNDAVCERLPQQTLGLLNLEAPRFLIYSWGQALKPANRSILTSGSAFGMCTNYQVTAEAATRAVVRIDGLKENPPNPHVVVEKYNILPPD